MVRVIGLFCTLAVLVAACGGRSDDEQPAADDAMVTRPAGSDANSSTPVARADATGPLPRLALQRVFPNVSINQPTGLYQASDGAWWATDQTGKVFRFEDREDARPALVLDITSRVNDSGSEEGLLGLAFAPDFATSGAFYLNYTAANPRRTVVSRFIANAADGTSVAANSETVILEVNQPFSNHNGGQIAFGPDGFLYIALGDGGSGNDPQGNGQNLNALLGKILRIDVSRGEGDRSYAIPADNPFAGRNDARGEIWAYGLRNPWRFSFDSSTGHLWAGDVGQSSREEINLITAGGNYGWAIMEGTQCLGGRSCDQTGLILPVIDYARSGGRCSVTGGFVYRGEAIDSMRGAYVYGDYCSGEVLALRYDGNSVTQEGLVADLGSPLSSFAVDGDGEIYALNYGSGAIFELVAP